MNLNLRAISLRFVELLFWLLVGSGLYYYLFPAYARLFLSIAEFFINFFFPSIVLELSPENTPLVVIGSSFNIALGYNLVFLGSNVVLAVALILTTLRLSAGGAWGALAGMGIMVLCHALVVVFTVLYFLADKGRIFIPVNFTAFSVAFIAWAQSLLTAQLSYALFPFLAWIAVCINPLFSAFGLATVTAATKPQSAPGHQRKGKGRAGRQ